MTPLPKRPPVAGALEPNKEPAAGLLSSTFCPAKSVGPVGAANVNGLLLLSPKSPVFGFSSSFFSTSAAFFSGSSFLAGAPKTGNAAGFAGGALLVAAERLPASLKVPLPCSAVTFPVS